MKIIIAGPRKLEVYAPIPAAMAMCGYDVTEIISGGAIGADKFGEQWAKENNIPLRICRPDYRRYHPKAAPRHRNETMGKYADAAVIIWDGESRGTSHMISVMVKLEKTHFIALYKDPLWINPTYSKVEFKRVSNE